MKLASSALTVLVVGFAIQLKGASPLALFVVCCVVGTVAFAAAMLAEQILKVREQDKHLRYVAVRPSTGLR